MAKDESGGDGGVERAPELGAVTPLVAAASKWLGVSNPIGVVMADKGGDASMVRRAGAGAGAGAGTVEAGVTTTEGDSNKPVS